MLVAADIPNRLERAGEGFTLSVPDEEAERARAALDAFDADEPPRAARPLADERPVPWFLGVLVGSLLVAGFSVTGSPRAFERGAAVAGLMPAEPWRAVTALTLHLDAAHVAGNAVATAVLLPALAQRLGAGLALCLFVLTGAAGNVLAALAQAPAHAAVGASTATFGAIGMLGVLGLFAHATVGRVRWKSWTVPAASLVLLTLLGAGRGADVLAHVTGFLSGAVLGLATAPIQRPPGFALQALIGLATALAVGGCWLRAAW